MRSRTYRLGSRLAYRFYSIAPRAAAEAESAARSTADPVALRQTILEASLKNVPALGWTQDSIAKAVLDLKLPPLSHTLIERGPAELVEFYAEKKRHFANERVSLANKRCDDTVPTEANRNPPPNSDFATFASANSSSTRTSADALHIGLEAHIDFASPYVHTLPSALAVLLSDPQNLTFTVSIAMQIADDICNYGDIQSTRMDWYSERILAIILYGTTELYMITDFSEDLQDTRAFLQRNIATYRQLRASPDIAQRVRDMLYNLAIDAYTSGTSSSTGNSTHKTSRTGSGSTADGSNRSH